MLSWEEFMELVARGHQHDGLICLVGCCDKTIPAAAMALVRMDPGRPPL
jgi:dihydroxyacid dehydratase/phosphogluconate dehydratase